MNSAEERRPLRIVAIGDPHFKVNNAIQTVPFSRECARICEELQPDIIVVLGDTLNDNARKDVFAEMNALNFLLQLREICFVYLIIGNHDIPHKYDFMTGIHAFYAVKFWDGIHVVDTTITENVGDYLLTFVPYVPDGRFFEALDYSKNWRESDMIFAHQNFMGHSLSSRMSEDADVWRTDLPPMISGHIHIYENLPSNVLYVGTPYQQNYIDNSDNSISLLTLTGDVCNTNIYQHKRMRLKGIMEKRKEVIAANELGAYRIPENYLVKVIVEGYYEEIQLAKETDVYKILKSTEMKRLGYMVDTKEIPEDIIFEEYERTTLSFKDELIQQLTDEERILFLTRYGDD